jgi:hypothetical protein
MHKTKVAAFMAANALSGAGWDYDMTGSPDGNYHCLDSVGNNYVTVFKRTNGENDYTWFALYTLTCFGSTADAGTGRIAWTPWLHQTRMGAYSSFFARIGTSHINYYDAPDSTISGVTAICSMGNPGSLTSTASYSGPYGQSNTYFASSQNYYGFAVKDDSIVVISGYDLSAGLRFSTLSGHGFSSLFNSSDTESSILINLQPITGTGVSAWYENTTRSSVSGYGCGYSLISSQDGSVTNADILLLPIAYYTGMVQEYPFQSLTVFGPGNACFGKGVVNIELLAANMQNDSASIAPLPASSAANGNYLCVSNTSSISYLPINKRANASPSFSAYTALYVGWDPSNPDITQASAWTEYEGT